MSCRAIVVMGVAGCGKSSLGLVLAQHLGWRFVEGDDHHSDEAWAKMRRGESLNDADRVPWLNLLADMLSGEVGATGGVVLSCSALKQAYREQLRAATPALGFIYLELNPEQALARVAARAGGHGFPASLVQSQFDALEPPLDEPLVLRLNAMLSPAEQLQLAQQWLPSAAMPA